MAASPEASAVSVIEPPSRWSMPSIGELWQYRDLLWVLTRRDISVRYKQTAVGVAWAVLQPAALALVFSFFLGIVFDRNPAGNIPYPVFLVCGLTMWLVFAGALPRGSMSTIQSAHLISKVYFPRVLIPLSSILPAALDFAIGFGVLLIMMLLYGLTPSIHIFLVPLVFALAMLILTGATLMLSALTVRYRDVQIAVPLVITVGLYASAVIYPLDLLPDHTQVYLAINPFVGIMESFRWAVLPDAASPGLLPLVSLMWGVVLMAAGLLYFHRVERTFADVI